MSRAEGIEDDQLAIFVSEILSSVETTGSIIGAQLACKEQTSSGLSHCTELESGIDFELIKRSSFESASVPIVLRGKSYKEIDGIVGGIGVNSRSDFDRVRSTFEHKITSLIKTRYKLCSLAREVESEMAADALVVALENAISESMIVVLFAGSEFHLTGEAGQPLPLSGGVIVGYVLVRNDFKMPCLSNE